MPTRTDPNAPRHFLRLSEETWDEIKAAYLGGMTAREVAVRWKTSVSSVYNRASDGRWGKKTLGDAVARGHAAVMAAEETAVAVSGDLSAAVLRERALAAVGRALAGRRDDEALRLVRVAEGLARMADREDEPEAELTDAEKAAQGVMAGLNWQDHLKDLSWEQAILARELWVERHWGLFEHVLRYALGDRVYGMKREFMMPLLRWRAKHHGEEQAVRDRTDAMVNCYGNRFYDDDGKLFEGFYSREDRS